MVSTVSLSELTVVDYDPFAGPEILNIAPATESQKEIWTSCLLGGDAANSAYNESVSLRFLGKVNRAAMEKAVRLIIERHESLRGVFSANGRNICILSFQQSQFEYKDLSDLTIAEKKESISRQAKREVFKIFDLIKGPLFFTKLFKLSEEEYYLNITAHHIICDGWSLSLILQELGKTYSAFSQNIYPLLPPATSFCEYANEQFQFYGSKEYEQLEKYWTEEYKQNVPVLNLPEDFPRPAMRTYKSTRLDFQVDRELSERVKRLSYQAGCSFVATLSTAFEVFLHRLSGQRTIVLGLPAAGQAASGNVNLVGHCVNLLPLKSTIDPSLSFLSHLKQRKKSFLDSFEHQQLTFGSLLKKLNIARNASRIALVPVTFNVDMGMTEGVGFHDLTYEFISNPREFETFEIFLNISGSEKTLTFEWSFNTQLFKPETIKKMMESFSGLLETVTDNPSTEIKNLHLSNQKNLEAKLAQWNATTAPYSRNTPLHQLVEEASTKFAGKTALTFNKKSISFKELNIASNQLSHWMIARGIKPGDVIGVGVERSAEMVISLLAVMKSGAAYVPVDPQYPQERIEFMLADSSAKMFITSQKYKGKFSFGIQECIVEELASELEGLSEKAPRVSVSGNDIAYILYTSGSTGKPKGVMIEHHNVVNMLQSLQTMPGITEDDIFLAITTISFDIAAVEIFLPLITGATIAMADGIMARDGREILRVIKEQRVSIMQATPATYKIMMAAGWQQPLPLKALCGGEPMTKELAGKLLARCSAVYNMYGPTETTVYSTGKQIISEDNIITIGKPINNTQVYILDESQCIAPEGATGEICIAGEGVGRGYVQQEKLNSEKFIEKSSIVAQPGKMYRTGDLGKFLDNGEIQCFGRMDRQIKIRGFRIEPGEIEDAILKLGTCTEVLVTARQSATSDQKLVAYLVAETGSDKQILIEIKKIKEQLQQQLPAYLVPDQFVSLASIPLLPNGKVDYNALPAEDLSAKTVHTSSLAVTETEKLVSEVWKKFLNLKEISIDEDFFELGGHSIIAVQVMVRLEKETGIMLPLSTLLAYPTIRKLSALLSSDKDERQWKSLVPIKPSGTKDPIYIVHGAGLNVLIFNNLATNMDEDQPVYGLQAKGLDGTEEPLDRIEDIAAFYISEIVEQNPDGPYAIAGYSFGGIIAFEMAKQLRAMNKKVKMLAMIDSYAYQSDHFKPFYKRFLNSAYMVFMKVMYTFVFLIKEPTITAKYKIDFIKEQWKKLLSKPGKKNQPADKYYLYTKKIADKNEEAYKQFTLTPYDGTVDVFRAKILTYYMPDFKYLGWKPFALKGVTIYEVPGEHKDLLLPPNDKVFAGILQRALDDK